MFVSLFGWNERNSEQIEVSVLRKQTPTAFPRCEGSAKWVQEKRAWEGSAGGVKGGKKGGGRERRGEEERERRKRRARPFSALFQSISTQDLGARCKHHLPPAPRWPGYFLSSWL